nr:serpin-ZX-like [Malus domestica]
MNSTPSSPILSLGLSDGSTRGGPCVNSGNSLWVEHSLTVKPSFKRMLVNVYNAVIKEVSFGTDPDKAWVQVNSWTKKETKGLIPEALPPGSLERSVDPSETEECKFGLLDGSTVEAVDV